MRTLRLKKMYDNKAWLRDKDLQRLEDGETIQAKYVGEDVKQGNLQLNNGDIMTITPEAIPELKKNRSDKQFGSRFSSEKYWLWGILWKPDVDKQNSLFAS